MAHHHQLEVHIPLNKKFIMKMRLNGKVNDTVVSTFCEQYCIYIF